MGFGPTTLRRLFLLTPAMLLGIGIAIGIVGWGGFHTAMEASNSLEFCVSCHEMRDNVYEEYKKSIHYQNPSGVRAICSDCHVPREWAHKVIRKIQATKELYHWLVGSIDTKEKFAAGRHVLARQEWDRMRANDSHECRNCHSYQAMDFHKQDAWAASAMKGAMQIGKTCIDCHKGIAHAFPDINANHRAAFDRFAASVEQLEPAVGATLYAIAPVAFHLGGEGGAEAPDGEIAPATAVKVLAVDGKLVKIEITGWQRERSPEIFYQMPGKRILSATLSETAVAKAEAIEVVTDPNADRRWTRARLVAWTEKGHFSATIEPLWAIGARIYDDNCSLCHAARAPESYAANDWISHVSAMKRLVRLHDDEVALLQAYLQNHAKDFVPAKK